MQAVAIGPGGGAAQLPEGYVDVHAGLMLKLPQLPTARCNVVPACNIS